MDRLEKVFTEIRRHGSGWGIINAVDGFVSMTFVVLLAWRTGAGCFERL
jgi:hypothetical protein